MLLGKNETVGCGEGDWITCPGAQAQNARRRAGSNGSDWVGVSACRYDPSKQDMLAVGLLALEKILSEVLIVSSSIWNDKDLVIESESLYS